MKKRILSLLIMLFMLFSTLLSTLINNKTTEIDVEPISENVEVVEITKELDPTEVAIQEMQEKMDGIESIENKMDWFIKYKEIIKEYDGILDPPETIYDYFEEEEITLICRVVETETYQCDFMSKVNVANVVLNRYYNGNFGDTIKEVVTSPNQFCYGRANVSEDTKLAVEYAFMIEDTTSGSLFFHSNSKTNTFNGANYVFTDECGHHFFKK